MRDIMYLSYVFHALGFDGSIILRVSNRVAVKVGQPLLLKCDVNVTPGDFQEGCTGSNLAKVVGWKWNTANKGTKWHKMYVFYL